MDRGLLLSVQRKVLGGYINAEEFGHKDLLAVGLDESLFDLPIHKIVIKACNKLRSDNIPVSDYTVLDLLQTHGYPKGVQQEAEYLHLMTEWAITPNTFKEYIGMILKHKMEE